VGEVTTIGLDLAKRVFQAHGVDAAGTVVLERQMRRAELLRFFGKLPRCLIGLEACATAHYWGRELAAIGHEVRLIPPHYVKPYVRRNKSDRADAAAICEAVGRPSMRFVPVKNATQQAGLVVHRVRDVLIRQQTMLTNALRAHLAEFGIIEPCGRDGLGRLIEAVQAGAGLPEVAGEALLSLVRQIASLAEEINTLDRQLRMAARENEVARRLQTIPGVGPVIASALTATVIDARLFRNGRELAAWIGLTPRQHSTGGRLRLGGISKRGDRYLRRLLVNGAQAVLLRSKAARSDPWLVRLRAQKPLLKVAVALANKLARIAWAVMARGDTYRRPVTAEAVA
jgi:transposase